MKMDCTKLFLHCTKLGEGRRITLQVFELSFKILLGLGLFGSSSTSKATSNFPKEKLPLIPPIKGRRKSRRSFMSLPKSPKRANQGTILRTVLQRCIKFPRRTHEPIAQMELEQHVAVVRKKAGMILAIGDRLFQD